MTDTIAQKNNEGPKKDEWWAAFPAPKAAVSEITGDDVMKMFDDMDLKPEARPFLLVDVRRTDWEVRYTTSFSCRRFLEWSM
jgi:hypothetical protein